MKSNVFCVTKPACKICTKLEKKTTNTWKALVVHIVSRSNKIEEQIEQNKALQM